MNGCFDHMDHDWRLRMLRGRIDERAFLGRLRTWLKAGILETDGRVIPPDTGVPHGGVVAPVLAHVYWPEAVDRWVEKVVNPPCRGAAWLSRDADDLGCAFQCCREAEGLSQALPKRRGKVKLAVALETTRLLRFSRGHPGMTRRVTG